MANFKELVRIGKDAEIRTTQGGKAVMGFSAAFDNGWGDRKQTVWLDCSAWGERWEKVCQYITKGSQIVVEGSIGTREYDGKTYITLDVSDIKLTARSDSQQQAQQRPAPQQQRQAGQTNSQGYAGDGRQYGSNAEQSQQQAAPAGQFDEFDDIPFN